MAIDATATVERVVNTSEALTQLDDSDARRANNDEAREEAGSKEDEDSACDSERKGKGDEGKTKDLVGGVNDHAALTQLDESEARRANNDRAKEDAGSEEDKGSDSDRGFKEVGEEEKTKDMKGGVETLAGMVNMSVKSRQQRKRHYRRPGRKFEKRGEESTEDKEKEPKDRTEVPTTVEAPTRREAARELERMALAGWDIYERKNRKEWQAKSAEGEAPETTAAESSDLADTALDLRPGCNQGAASSSKELDLNSKHQGNKNIDDGQGNKYSANKTTTKERQGKEEEQDGKAPQQILHHSQQSQGRRHGDLNLVQNWW
jgi:hypothetical protein